MTAVPLAIFGGLAVIFAVLMLLQRTLFGSAMCLLIVLAQLAGMFFSMGAQLLAMMQILVYAGAIMVLIIIAIMAAPPRFSTLWASYDAPPAAVALILGVLLAEFLVVLLYEGAPLPTGEFTLSAAQVERQMSWLLFNRYAGVTELVGLLILAASLAVV
ncbi:MAG: NADH-quinone oxidoreductase subunit J [Elusimicrobia bacterium]|nr:NADH-quinone oxidoreductase subunit J [Elusimicrobiota bacterium]